jgi:hypothetical protein
VKNQDKTESFVLSMTGFRLQDKILPLRFVFAGTMQKGIERQYLIVFYFLCWLHFSEDMDISARCQVEMSTTIVTGD